MVNGGLFEDLPPPSARPVVQEPPQQAAAPPPPPPPAKSIESVKPALKRPASDSQNEGTKQVRFKTTTDTTKEKAIEAMQKIAIHIGNPAKFSKASKLAVQLLVAGSVDKDNSELFYEILRASMSPPNKATAANVRADYQRLFSEVEERRDYFTKIQQEQIDVWLLWAQLANDFYTDDTFVFSKAAGRLEKAISSLPEITTEEEKEASSNVEEDKEPTTSQVKPEEVDPFGLDSLVAKKTDESEEVDPFGLDSLVAKKTDKSEEVDPFGLDALMADKPDKHKRKKDDGDASRRAKELLKQRREALVECISIATKRYKQQWAQTTIDITAKHAYDNVKRFEPGQREQVEKMYLSVKEQQVKRKQGKSSTGKLDVTSFERYREMFSNEKISIRKAVGASGDRGAEQWLG